MNSVFSFTRFGRLFRKHTVENYRSYLMAAGVLSGIIVLLYSFYALSDEIDYKQRGLFFVFLYMASGTVFTSTVFSDYGLKRKSIVSLVLPASHFEKYIVPWIYSLLIYTIVFLVCFYAIDSLFLNASTSLVGDKRMLDILSKEEEYYTVFLFYLVLHAVAIYGSIAFKNLHFIKTAFIFFSFLVVYAIINYQFLKMLLPVTLRYAPPLSAVQFLENHLFKSLSVDSGAYRQFLSCFIPITIWAAAFFRLKEKQV